jgi:hypothetical protein
MYRHLRLTCVCVLLHLQGTDPRLIIVECAALRARRAYALHRSTEYMNWKQKERRLGNLIFMPNTHIDCRHPE